MTNHKEKSSVVSLQTPRPVPGKSHRPNIHYTPYFSAGCCQGSR